MDHTGHMLDKPVNRPPTEQLWNTARDRRRKRAAGREVERLSDRFTVLQKQCMSELSQVFDRMNDASVRDLLEEIKRADRVFLLGGGREGLATRAFAMRLMHLGKPSYWIWDDTTPSIGEGDLMICACGSADTGHENYITGMAKKAGARLALVTAADDGFISGIADVRVKVPAAAYRAKGDYVPTRQLMGNLFEQALFIFYDILVMMLREEMGVAPEEMVSRHRNVE